MVETLQAMINHTNSEHAAANSTTNAAGVVTAPAPAVQQEAFELSSRRFEDDDGEESGEE
jgi:hypothetical protein